MNHQVSVSGASDKVNYLFSAGYYTQDGIVGGNFNRSNYERLTLRSNTQYTLFDESKNRNWLNSLKVTSNLSYARIKSTGIEANSTWGSPLGSALALSPMLTVYDEGDAAQAQLDKYANTTDYTPIYDPRNGKLFSIPGSEFGEMTNPIANLSLPGAKNWSHKFVANFSAELQLWDNLRFKTSYGADLSFWGNDGYTPLYYLRSGGASSRSTAYSEKHDGTVWQLENVLMYDKTIDKHTFSVLLGQSAKKNTGSYLRGTRNNIINYSRPYLNASTGQAADGDQTAAGAPSEIATLASLFARASYNYDERYMFQVTIRRDGSSRFGSNNHYAVFPSFSLGWNLTNEKFMQKRPEWLTSTKVRFSWGKNGNRSLANSYLSLANLGAGLGATMNYLNPDGSVATDMKYLMMDRLANPGLQWEKTESFNIGLDFAVLDNRLSGSIDYYFKKTHDMIMSQRLPNFSGFSSIYTNLGEIQNTGVELSFSSVNIDRPNFRWTSTLNFSFNANKINHLYYEYEDVIDNTGNVIGKKEMDDKTNGWFIGKAIDEIWDFKVEGIWQVDEAEKASLVGQRPGDPKVSNIYTADDIINEDGTRTPVYNDRDKVFQGKKTPPIYWNLRNNFTIWKNLDIYFSLYSYMGHKSKSVNYLNQLNQASSVTYAFNNFKGGYWLPENPTNKYARLDALGPSGATAPAKVYNRSFIRLDNISLGYTLPQKWTRKFLIDRIRVTASIRNIAVFTNDWEYGDPETGGLATRTYNFGLNFTL